MMKGITGDINEISLEFSTYLTYFKKEMYDGTRL